MHETLLISKPLVPPWNDSGKNLVRDIVRNCPGFRHHVLTACGRASGLGGVIEEAVYTDAGRYAPSRGQNLRVLARLLRPDSQALYHFFFAPNPATSFAARAVLAVKSRRSVQTVLSVPRSFDGMKRLVFAERVVAHSRDTRDRLVAAGVRGVVHIPPGIETRPATAPAARDATLSLHGLPPGAPIVIYAGDFEFSDAASVVARAVPAIAAASDATVVFACRSKRPSGRAAEAAIRSALADHVRSRRVAFLGEVADVRSLLAAAAVVVLPAESSYAKMDLPLVLLEAMAEGVPVVVADVAPLREVLGHDEDRPTAPVGVAVPPCDPGALADAVVMLLADAGLRQRLGDAAREWARARFDARAMGEAHAALYRELLDG